MGSLLLDRQFRMRVDRNHSQYRFTATRVPQGAEMFPQFYSIYKAKVQYTNDTKTSIQSLRFGHICKRSLTCCGLAPDTYHTNRTDHPPPEQQQETPTNSIDQKDGGAVASNQSERDIHRRFLTNPGLAL